MENPRTTTARDNDDHELIDAAVAEADTDIIGGSASGHLGADVGTEDDLARAVDDPDAHTRATKQNDIDAGVAYDSDQRGANKQ